MTSARYFAGVELGGTKSIVVLAREREIVDRAVIPTGARVQTLRALSDQLRAWQDDTSFVALGIASFGPLQLSPHDPDFGRMLPTPKIGWQSAPITETLTRGLDCPWWIDTDVNAAALAEYHWGAGAGQSSVCYITIGTGVGGGLVIDGRPIHGAMHPEIGHLQLRRASAVPFPGTCPFHGDCIEGLVSGPALAARMGGDPAAVPDGDPRWEPVVCDIAELACAILLTTSAQRILIGGGVGMARPFFLEGVRLKALERLAGYLPFFNAASAEEIIRAPALGSEAGPMGAITLAHAALGADLQITTG